MQQFNFSPKLLADLQKKVILHNPLITSLVREIMELQVTMAEMQRRYLKIQVALKKIRVLDEYMASKTGTERVYRMRAKRSDAGKSRKVSKKRLPHNVIPIERGKRAA